MINCTTGTSIGTYFDWVEHELENKEYGEVSITFIVTRGQVTDVKRISADNDHHPLTKKVIDEIDLRR